MFVWQAHKGKVRSLAFSPDGHFLATVTGKSRLVSLWNPVTGALVRKLESSSDERVALSVAFAPDAPLFAAGMTKSVRVWDTASWTVVAVLTGRERWSGNYYELAFGRGPNPRLAAGEARHVHVWENAGDERLTTPRHPEAAFRVENVPCLDFSPDGKLLATNVLASAALWKPAGELVRIIEHTHSNHHGPVKFSPDGTRLAVGYRNLASIYSVADPADAPITCAGHTKAVWSACWSADGRALLTASADGTTRLWNPATGAELRAFAWDIGELHATAFSADGLLGAAAGTNGKVVVWDVDG